MTIPITNISLSLINTELGLSSNSALSIGNSLVRVLAGKASGAVSYSDLKNKSNRKSISLTISSWTNNYNAYSSAVATGNYVAGKTDITITVNSGVYVGGGYIAGPAMTISGFTAGDTVTLNNNGGIVGYGGAGGNGGYATLGTDMFGTSNVIFLGAPSAGAGGGTGLSLGFATTINNAGLIAGGGGGGGGGGGFLDTPMKTNIRTAYGGGGGGGGAGMGLSLYGQPLGGYGGAGGSGLSQSSSGGAVSSAPSGLTGGSGIGRYTDGYFSSAIGGLGGSGSGIYLEALYAGSGGTSGSLGEIGSTGGVNSSMSVLGAVGGAAGYYISGGSYATWAATGTRLGLAG